MAAAGSCRAALPATSPATLPQGWRPWRRLWQARHRPGTPQQLGDRQAYPPSRRWGTPAPSAAGCCPAAPPRPTRTSGRGCSGGRRRRARLLAGNRVHPPSRARPAPPAFCLAHPPMAPSSSLSPFSLFCLFSPVRSPVFYRLRPQMNTNLVYKLNRAAGATSNQLQTWPRRRCVWRSYRPRRVRQNAESSSPHCTSANDRSFHPSIPA